MNTTVHRRDFDRRLALSAFEELCRASHDPNRLPPLWPMVELAASPRMPQSGPWLAAVLRRFPRSQRLVLPGSADVSAGEWATLVVPPGKELDVRRSFFGSRCPDVSRVVELEALSVGYMNSGDESLSSLIAQNGGTLRRLSLYSVNAVVASCALANCTRLEAVALAVATAAFTKSLVLQCAATLTSLQLNFVRTLSKQDFEDISAAIGPRLKSLSLSFVDIGDSALLSFFTNCVSLETLGLYIDTSSCAEGVTDASLCCVPSNLKRLSLELRIGTITRRAWEHIAMTSGATLESFSVTSAQRSWAIAESLLPTACHLTTLCLATEERPDIEYDTNAIRMLINKNAATLRWLWLSGFEAFVGALPLLQLRCLRCDASIPASVLAGSCIGGMTRLEHPQFEWPFETSHDELFGVIRSCPRIVQLSVRFDASGSLEKGLPLLIEAVAQLGDLVSLNLHSSDDEEELKDLLVAVHEGHPTLHLSVGGETLYNTQPPLDDLPW